MDIHNTEKLFNRNKSKIKEIMELIDYYTYAHMLKDIKGNKSMRSVMKNHTG